MFNLPEGCTIFESSGQKKQLFSNERYQDFVRDFKLTSGLDGVLEPKNFSRQKIFRSWHNGNQN